MIWIKLIIRLFIADFRYVCILVCQFMRSVLNVSFEVKLIIRKNNTGLCRIFLTDFLLTFFLSYFLLMNTFLLNTLNAQYEWYVFFASFFSLTRVQVHALNVLSLSVKQSRKNKLHCIMIHEPNIWIKHWISNIFDLNFILH